MQIQIASCLVQAAVVTPKLTIAAAMSSVPSDGRPHPAIYIGIEDGKGKPYALTHALNVTLSSSDSATLSLPAIVSIPPASCFYTVNATSNVVGSKNVEVSAAASGFVSAKTSVTVGPPAGAPSSLEVTILPNVLLPVIGEKADLFVTLVDSFGNPTPARTNLNVALFSSNLNIAELALGAVVIPEGSTMVKTTLTATGKEGATTITASTPNLKSDTATLTVTGPQATKINIWALGKLPVNDDSNILFVGITDASSNPVKLLTPKTINLYSSDKDVVTVQSTVTIPAGSWCAVVPLNCISVNGTTTLSAASDNLDTDTLTVRGTESSDGDVKSLKLYPIATGFPADDDSQEALLVQFLDGEGQPAKASAIDSIDFYSDASDIAEVVGSASIHSGDSAALVNIWTKLPGTAVITAGTTSYGTTTATVKSYAPIPDKVVIQTPPIPAGGEVEACLVTLKGAVPAPVSENTLIQLSSSDTQVGSSDVDSIVVGAKTYLKYLKVRGSSPGTFSLTVSPSGIPSVKISFKVLDTNPSTFKLSAVKPAVNYEFPVLIQMGNSGGVPSVSPEPVRVNVVASNASNVIVPSSVTIEGDNTELIFYARALSTKQTTLTVSAPGFKSTTLQLTPNLVQTSAQLKLSSKMPMNKPTDVQFTLTVNGEAVEDVLVEWIGAGFTYPEVYTDSKGVAENSYVLLQEEDYVEAKVRVGGGYITASKTIAAVPDEYHLDVTANVPISSNGSGTYSYGDKITLEAPLTAPMPHVLGLLGGKYVFVEWVGAINTSGNSIVLTIDGDHTELRAEAMYATDYTMLLVVVGLLVVVSAAGFVLYKKKKIKLGDLFKKKPKDDKSAKQAAPPSPVKH